MKRFLRPMAIALSAVIMCTVLAACGDKDKDKNNSTSEAGAAPAAEANVTNERVITVNLLTENFEDTCNSFKKLVKDGYFNGLGFEHIYNGIGVMSETAEGDTPNRLVITFSDYGLYLDDMPFGQISAGTEDLLAMQNIEKKKDDEGIRSVPVTPAVIKNVEVEGDSTAKFTLEFTEKEPREQVEGTFTITLYADKAPITCVNFEDLITDGFYDGLTFHRVVEDFMAQGGDPEGTGAGGSDKNIKGEFSSNGVDNDLSHTRGIVSMARSSDPDSASSQFFICYSDDDTFLDGNYAAFGEVTEGMETVDGFLEVELAYGSDGAFSSPMTPITITKAEMIEDDAEGNHRAKFTVKY